MCDRIVSVKEAQASLPALIHLVREGREVLISEGEEVIARIAPVTAPRRTPGLNRGAIRTAPGFDDPLPDSYWEGKT